MVVCASLRFFFFNDTATTEIYTLPLHDALPISARASRPADGRLPQVAPPRARSGHARRRATARDDRDRKSTRLNSSHLVISYAVFCLKKKNVTHLSRLDPSTERSPTVPAWGSLC